MKNALKNTIVIFAVFFLAVFLLDTFSSKVINLAKEQVALVSEVGATVAETPTNRLASELRDKSKELDLREKALFERELLLQKEKESIMNRTRNILISTIFLSLVTLFIINIYIYRRDKKSKTMKNSFSYSSLHTGKRDFRIDLHT